MDTILALREKRKNLWDAAKAFLDTARDENGMVSAEDAARYDKMEADVVNLGKEIDRWNASSSLMPSCPSRQRCRLLNSLAQARMEQKRKAVRPMPIVRLSGTASAIRTSLMYRTP